MEYYETIIVGAGPAGSSCAWRLKQAGRDVLVLDKAPFPRLKLCAGWITSQVLRDLNLTVNEYPHSILELSTRFHLASLPFISIPWIIHWDKLLSPGTNYSIRRIEFDNWLLQRSEAPFKVHQVKHIDYQDGNYVIDEQFSCRYLVGAGGTGCPVRRKLFPHQRPSDQKIRCLETEFFYPQRDTVAHIFFFNRGLLGYSWYVPKGNGHLNIGLGGLSHSFQGTHLSIHEHFQDFLHTLSRRNLLEESVACDLQVSGYSYYLSPPPDQVKRENCFLIGDSAGLATLDFGEGIGPAINSGRLAAQDILGQGAYEIGVHPNCSIRLGFHWIYPTALAGLSSLTALKKRFSPHQSVHP